MLQYKAAPQTAKAPLTPPQPTQRASSRYGLTPPLPRPCQRLGQAPPQPPPEPTHPAAQRRAGPSPTYILESLEAAPPVTLATRSCDSSTFRSSNCFSSSSFFFPRRSRALILACGRRTGRQPRSLTPPRPEPGSGLPPASRCPSGPTPPPAPMSPPITAGPGRQRATAMRRAQWRSRRLDAGADDGGLPQERQGGAHHDGGSCAAQAGKDGSRAGTGRGGRCRTEPTNPRPGGGRSLRAAHPPRAARW